MSYGYFSEVYFAISHDVKNLIKIGETSNARRRQNQLYEEGFFIEQVRKVDGDDSARWFIEDYLRLRIEATGKVKRYRKDYFECEDKMTVEWIANHFPLWVEEANRMLNCITYGGTTNVNFGEAHFPIPPEGKEELFKQIYFYLENYGKYSTTKHWGYWQEKEHLEMLKKAFSPFGYECISERKTSWVTFKIRKI